MNRVVLVGAGCGEGTITLRGAELLRQCDCVVYDSLIDAALLRFVREDCARIFVGKRAGAHAASQEEICRVLVRCTERKRVAVGKRGDLGGGRVRRGEELEALAAAGVRCGVVPGVTAAVAAAEWAGIPVTHRGTARGFCVYTAHTAGEPFCVPAPEKDTTYVFLMAKANAPAIQRTLLEGGMSEDTPAAVISDAGMAGGKAVRCTLKNMPREAARLPAPLTVVVGETCREDLLGKQFFRCFLQPSVVVTGTADHTARVAAALAAKGFSCVPCATLAAEALPFDRVFSRLEGYKYLVFTSANGVRLFFARARALRFDVRRLAGKKFAAIGAHTAEALQETGILPDLVPPVFTAEALARALASAGALREETALLRAEAGSEALCGAGEQISLYRTRTDEAQVARARAALAAAKYVTFGSAGGVRALLEGGALPETVTPVCIGEETAKELKKRGYAPVVAASCTAAALAEAVARKEASCNG